MKRDVRMLTAAGSLLLALSGADAAVAQKQGGILRSPFFDSPASMSMLEESTFAANRPLMAVFNNLVTFDQHVAQNGPKSIETDQRRCKQLVWDIERKLAEDDARPILFYGRIGTCRQPQVKGLTVMVNSIYFEDLWLDK
jgi:hypothetical protein